MRSKARGIQNEDFGILYFACFAWQQRVYQGLFPHRRRARSCLPQSLVSNFEAETVHLLENNPKWTWTA